MPQDRSELDHPVLIRRLRALLDALRATPLARHELLAQLGDAYPQTASARRMIDRDILRLAQLGIIIEKTNTRPPIYTLRGAAPALSVAELRALALVRDTFGSKHPQFMSISALLDTLTLGLNPEQQAEYARRQASRAPLQPAIDYTPHAATIARLELAISQHEIISFRYTNSQGLNSAHEVEPYEIEYYERHFYLIAYHQMTRQLLDYRIDRVGSIRTVQTLPTHLSHTHERTAITFRYRLAAVLARGEISQRFENQRIIERLPNGDVIVEAEGRSDFFIIQALLRYRDNVELLEPNELRKKIIAEVRRLAGMYGYGTKEQVEGAKDGE